MIFEKPELLEKFQQLQKDKTYDAVEYWYPYVSPYVEQMELARKAVLISIASGNDTGRRNRVHVLMYGPPGTAKSELRNWAKYQMGAIGIGPTTSEVGLKGSAAGGDIKPGALAMADKGILVIDEADKFSRQELTALLEAMEEGKYEITKGGNNVTLNAECRVIACANDISRFPPELLDRFDFKIQTSVPSRDVEKKITDKIYDTWLDDGRTEEDYAYELGKYLEYTQLFNQKGIVVPKKSMEIIKRVKNMYIDLKDSEPNIRSKESLLRVAIVIARLNLKPLFPEHFIEAIHLLDPTFNGGKLDALKTLVDRCKKEVVDQMRANFF